VRGRRALPRPDAVVEPIMEALRARFPAAEFAVRRAPDGSRYYLDIAIDREDDFVVLEAAAPACIALLLERDTVVHVMAFRRLPR
jgi:hypothetical protein